MTKQTPDRLRAALGRLDAMITSLRKARDAARTRDRQASEAEAQQTFAALRERATELRKALHQRGQLKAKIKLMEVGDMDRKNILHDEEQTRARTAASPLHVFVCDRQVRSNGWIFNRGCVVTPEQIGPNFDKLVHSGFIVPRLAANVAGCVKPIAMPTPTPPKQKVEAVVFNGGDAVQDWRKSVDETAKRCNGDVARARDLLMSNDRGGELYVRAVRTQAERDRVANRTVMRKIAPAI
jgi:hypothetical protein